MPFAVALLNHPAGLYGFVLIAVIGLTYGVHARRFLPSFTGGSAALLTTFGFVYVRPSVASIVLLAAGIALLHAEFLVATGGVVGALGFGAVAGGSWALLGSEPLALPPSWRLLFVAIGALTLLIGIERALRRATLPQ